MGSVIQKGPYRHESPSYEKKDVRAYLSFESILALSSIIGPMKGVIATPDIVKKFYSTPDIEGKNARHPTFKIHPTLDTHLPKYKKLFRGGNQNLSESPSDQNEIHTFVLM